MKIHEQEILSEELRKKIIKEIIDGTENRNRRYRELRKHEIYRDKNSKWVMDALRKEGFQQTTLFQMQNRASNISICRKIVNKLARAYNGGVSREVEDAKSQASIDALIDELDVDTLMKKSDRYRQLHRNCMIKIVPVLDRTQSIDKPRYRIRATALSPWQYDVIEDPDDETKPMVVILSDFTEQYDMAAPSEVSELQGAKGYREKGSAVSFTGNRRDEVIADDRADRGTDDRRFIWWTANFHFTTNAKGQIIAMPNPGAEILQDAVRNPIGTLPFINVADDQDGFFWAEGGEDVVETSILVNKIMTDLNFVTFTQGYGQLVISGKDLPKKIVGGPDRAMIFDVKDGDPTPQVFYASSNPPIESWLNTVKTILAMVLTTNNLSPRNLSASLDVQNAASGIAMIIEQAESVQDVKDIQGRFQDLEPLMWEVIRRWFNLYHETDSLVPDLQAIDPFNDADVKVRFHETSPPVSEKERLEVLRMRKELGLNTKVELLLMDDPDLSRAEAEEKAAELGAADILKTVNPLKPGGVDGKETQNQS